MYGPRISLIMLPSPCTSVTTSSFTFPVLLTVSIDVGSFGIDICEADGIALCFEKAIIGSVCKVDVVIGVGDRDLDLTYTCMIGLLFGAADRDLDLIDSCAPAFCIAVKTYQEMKQRDLASVKF